MDMSRIVQSINRAFSKLPPELGALPEDVKQMARLLTRRVLEEMDFVTREEFEVQQQVLYKTRMKLEALERQVERCMAERRGEEEGSASDGEKSG